MTLDAAPSISRTIGEPVGADLVLRTLESEGIDLCFGMPGGAILPLYDALARGTTIRHVLVRHEQGAGHMAQGYARASGRPGVAFATSGPGATNLVTPIADAMADSTPLVCITGQVRQDLLGSEAFQECDITGITMPIVKHSWLVTDPDELQAIIRDAVRLSVAGRPGPVLVDLPRDVQEARVAARADAPAPAEPDTSSPTTAEVAAVVRALSSSRRPLLYVGGGAQGASDQVLRLAHRAAVPVVTTLMGKGAFPESDPLFCGWPGMHGCRTANHAMHHADLIIAAGARFDDRVTGRLDAFAPHATIIHIDIDPYEHHKIRRADLAIRGELGQVLAAVAASLEGPCHTDDWLELLASWRAQFPLLYDVGAGTLKPQAVLETLVAATRSVEDVIWTTGVGQHQMWAMQYLATDRPRSFITSGGHGTMGFGLPAAIGAKAARPEASVVCVDGDGSFPMTLQELSTSVASELPVTVVILNNGHLGMVHQWQDMFYDERLSHVDLSRGMPDYAAIARGFGAFGYTVTTPDELAAALPEALASPRTAVLDVHVDRRERCYPMIVPGGRAVDQLEWPGDS